MGVLEHFPSCTVTAPGSVFRVLYSSRPGVENTQRNCLSSLETFDREAEKRSLIQTICSILSIFSLVACVLAALLACLIKWLNRLSAERHLRNSGARSAASAWTIGRAAIEKHFPVSYSKDGNPCVVCLLDIEEHEPGRRLQCGHEFHADCIVDWWTHTPRLILECPLCKCKQTLVEGGQQGAEGQAQIGRTVIAAWAAPDAATIDVDRSHSRSNDVEEMHAI